MTTFLLFEQGISLTVDEDAETVRERLAGPKDGFAELHAREKRVFVQVNAVKYAEEQDAEPGGIGFNAS